MMQIWMDGWMEVLVFVDVLVVGGGGGDVAPISSFLKKNRSNSQEKATK
jgi:hypothetical protein